MAAAPVTFTGLKRVAPSEVAALQLDPIDDKTRQQALDIVQKVKSGGEEALLELATQFKDLPEGAQ